MNEPRRRKDDDRIDQLADEIAELKGLVAVTQKNTADIIEFWQSVQGGIKVLGILGIVAKWVAAIAGAVAAVLGAYHVVKTGGDLPKLPEIPTKP